MRFFLTIETDLLNCKPIDCDVPVLDRQRISKKNLGFEFNIAQMWFCPNYGLFFNTTLAFQDHINSQ